MKFELGMEIMGPELSKTVPGMSLRPPDRFLGLFKAHFQKWKIAKNHYDLAKIAKLDHCIFEDFCDFCQKKVIFSDFPLLEVNFEQS